MATAKDIITLPDARLHEKSRRVGFIDETVIELAKKMMEATLDWESHRKHEVGVALAAVQIAELWRVVVVRHNFDDKTDERFAVYINPEIVKVEGEPVEDMEGCLSVKDVYGAVKRYPKVKIKALDLDGNQVRRTLTGFEARVFQHEIDHTNGIVFVDRIENPSKLCHLLDNGHFGPLDPAIAALYTKGEQ